MSGPTDNTVALMALASGVSLYDLSVITRKPEDELKQALSAVPPIRGGNSRTHVYDIAQALPAIYANDAATAERITEAIKKMKPTQLPPALQKEFWSAQRARLDYLEDVKDLWRTERVMQVLSKVLGIQRQAMTLLEDNTDQRDTLTAAQRAYIRSAADSVLLETQRLMQEEFATWDGEPDRETLNPAEGFVDAEPPGDDE